MLSHNNSESHPSTVTAHPLSFVLHYEDWKYPNTVFRDDGSPPMPVTVDIFNETKNQIILQKPDSQEASADNCHFEFRWEKGVVASPKNVTLEDGGDWIVKSQETKTHVTYFFLYYKDQEDLILEPKTEHDHNVITLTLDKLVAFDQHTANLTNLALVCGPHMLGHDGKPFTTPDWGFYMSVTNTIGVVNRPEKERIPLHVGFVSANTILNDGSIHDGNTLTLRLVNILNPQQYEDEPDRGAIHFKDSSQFILSFDYSDASEQWALCKNGAGITVSVSDTNNWEVYPQPSDSNREYWIIRPPSETGKLDAGATLELTITGISTDYPSGCTNLYLRYQDIPSYANGEFVLPIEKTPLLYYSPLTPQKVDNTLTAAVLIKPIFNNDNGSSNPQIKPIGLAVDGGGWINIVSDGAGIRFDGNAEEYDLSHNEDVVATEIYKKSGDGLKIKAHDDTQGIEFLKADNSTTQMMIKDGKVGIGITSPEEKLHIKDGSLRIDNGKIKSWGTITFQPNTDQSPVDEDLIKFLDKDGDSVAIIKHDGKVGIGTTSPSAKLEIKGTTDEDLIKFLDKDENSVAIIKHDGKVGIGLDDPLAKLEVSGELRVRNKDNANATWDHLSLSTDGTKSYIESYNDDDGLWIKSNSQNKVHIDSDLEVTGQLLDLVTDGAKIRFDGDAEIYKKVGSGLKIKAHSDYHGIEFLKADNSTTQMVIKDGNVGIGISNPAYQLDVSGNSHVSQGMFVGQVPVWDGTDDNDLTWNGSRITREGSSKKYKQNIYLLEDDFFKILSLEPKQYQMKEEYGPKDNLNFGYIAEELDELGLTNLVIYDESKQPDGIKYKKICIYLLEVVKDLNKKVDSLLN